MLKLLAAAAFVGGAIAGSAGAQTIAWTDWTSASQNGVVGAIAAPGGTINVSYTGPYAVAQTSAGYDWWTPGNYNGTYNKPSPANDIIELSAGGTKTISFDVPVTDPYIALMSWNGNVVDFGTTIEVVANGSGYWGSGTMVLNGAGTGFTGFGEVHGIIRLPGTFTSITFIDTSENWHGFTLGVLDVAPPPNPGVPEPATWAMLIAGFGLVGFAARRRKTTVSA